MSLAQGNNIPTRPRIEPIGSPDPGSDALTTRPVRPLMVVEIFKRFIYHPNSKSHRVTIPNIMNEKKF